MVFVVVLALGAGLEDLFGFGLFGGGLFLGRRAAGEAGGGEGAAEAKRGELRLSPSRRHR